MRLSSTAIKSGYALPALCSLDLGAVVLAVQEPDGGIDVQNPRGAQSRLHAAQQLGRGQELGKENQLRALDALAAWSHCMWIRPRRIRHGTQGLRQDKFFALFCFTPSGDSCKLVPNRLPLAYIALTAVNGFN